MKFEIALGYNSKLDKLETLKAINIIKNNLKQKIMERNLLIEINPALVTNKELWLNDDFQGTQRALDFDLVNNNFYGEILQSNNKYRRHFLMKNGLQNVGDGVISDFSCLRRDEKIGNTTSNIYDEIGFEIVVNKYETDYLNDFIVALYGQLISVDEMVKDEFDQLEKEHLSTQITFISFSKLKALYPFISFKERLNRFAKENGSFVLTNFVKKLFNTKDLNNFSEDVFDFNSYSIIYTYNPVTESAVEIAYLSYSVDREILQEQNLLLKENFKTKTGYDHLVTTGKLPLTISGGVYTSKFTMLVLEKNHIAEVQNSIWSKDFEDFCDKNEINIL
ncbi:hypothetical protein [Spiroplasma alleghenense]|uniref:Asparagine synthetase AsnA n=1 Tax=Spiroplasma alleghenense TaxID=216931 RepID=A0A345Z266_9MOLU|nr:hypothetical protein [Spiroplasma alleghenense]AXK50695.1 asparagine synthetase AsnA [Spiroplasma alleghenense]